MRIATWNINGLRARLDFVLHWLNSRQPDIVGLQELKLTEEKFPIEEIENAGYCAAIHGQKAWNGVAVLGRKSVTVQQRGLPHQEEAGARLISVSVASLSLINVYCPNGKHTGHADFDMKLSWFDSLQSYIETTHRKVEPVVLCGDFNICPTKLDSWNEEGLQGKIFHTNAERERVRNLLQWGLYDVFRNRYPDRQAFSWWDYRAGAFHRNMGLRIDFLLATKPILDRVESIEIDREYRKKKDGLTASDHAPVIMHLRD